MAATRVRCGGYWLDALAKVGDLEWSTRAPDGTSVAASWRMALDPLFEHPALRRGKKVEIYVGPKRVWLGTLNEPIPSPQGWEFHATGYAAMAEDALALNASGGTTSTPNTAVDQAIARGAVPWTRPGNFSGSALKTGDSTDALNELGAVLDDWAEGAGKRWGVNPDGEAVAVADPTVPSWHIVPGIVLPASADDEYVTHLYGRYQSGSSPDTFDTVTASNQAQADRFGRVEEEVDLTPLGVITAAKAQEQVDGMLALCKAELGWSDAIEVARNEITTAGGASADLRLVMGGQVVRLHGQVSRDGSRMYQDFLIGETQYRDGEPLITLSPAEKVARTLSEILSVDAPKKGKKKKRRKRRRRMRR